MEKLYKALYNAARMRLPVSSQNNPDAVKACRDHACWEAFRKGYREMDEHELTALISALNTVEGVEKYATTNQIGMLRFHAFKVALIYCNMQDWEYYDPEAEVTLKGEDLRRAITHQFYHGKTPVPANIVRRIYEEWINPKAHQYLMEGEYRQLVYNPKILRYEQLKSKEIQYLINRFAMVYDQAINKTVGLVRAELN